MLIRQDAEVKTAVIEQGHNLEIATQKKLNYVHVISGQVMIGDHLVQSGDALVFDETTSIKALQDSHMIWFDLP